ncbi:MAG: hypothetical protein PHF50_03795 [Patescibacteria group bacterium]|nr:hypothetical protein [Patescibacteria group bacterium]
MPNNINNDMPDRPKTFINYFFYELFYVLTAAILIFAGLEIFWPGVVLAYLNLNYVLIFWLVTGIIILS